MKKLSIVAILALVTVTALILKKGGDSRSPTSSGSESDPSTTSSPRSGEVSPEEGLLRSTKQGDSAATDNEPGTEETELEQPDRPATEIYRNAEDALKAVKDGASHYDDLILEQFESPPTDCSWCSSFYESIRTLAFSADTPADQKSYFAEILSISARPENLEALIEGIEKAPNEEAGQVYAEALEMASATRDDLVKLLGSHLSSPNEILRESLVAAVTNQGTPLALETLYKYTVASNDPDGFYSKGTGLGEAVASPEAFPFLKEMAEKRDDYSHLAIKALLNSGADGVRATFDILRASKNDEGDKKLLRDAIEHVNFDEDTEAIIRAEVEKGTNPLAVEFAREIKKNFDEESAQLEKEAQEEESSQVMSVDEGED